MTQPKKVNYLNNKDILKQIHYSKMSYCYVQDDKYSEVDLIVESVKKINKSAIKQAQINKAAKLSTLAYQQAAECQSREMGRCSKPKSQHLKSQSLELLHTDYLD